MSIPDLATNMAAVRKIPLSSLSLSSHPHRHTLNMTTTANSSSEKIRSKGSGTDTTTMEEEEDQIVNIELEAAEVLAGLATMQSPSSIRRSDGGVVDDSAGKWGLKGKRARKRTVKSELPAAAAAKFSAVVSSETCQGQNEPETQDSDDVCRNLKIKSVKAEQAELSRTGSSCNQSNGLLCRMTRSRQNLTEAEKEERRTRRILANRESARQTIRRRQAICEELTKRAADLSVENANLKRDKELFEKEYTSLKNMNEYLKEQMAIQINTDDVETLKESTSVHVEVAAPQLTKPVLLCNAPRFTPFVSQPSNHIQLPKDPENSVVSPEVPTSLTLQSSYSVESVNVAQHSINIAPEVVPSSTTQSSSFFPSQNEPKNPIILSSDAPLTVFGPHHSSRQVENGSIVNVSQTPICLLPCHWLFPLHDHGMGVFRRHQDESTTSYTANNSSSSHTLAYVENQEPSVYAQLNSESGGNEETRTAYNLNETPFGFRPYGQSDADSNIRVINPTPLSPIAPAGSTKHENMNTQGFLNQEATSSVATYKNGACVIYTSKTQDEVLAAAEARKKRKELTRLKNLRSFRINC